MAKRSLFISYSHHDAEIARQLASLLRIAGAKVFRDQDSISPGKRWVSVTTKSLSTADCVLVFWSANSASSSAVKEEYLSAISQNKDVVPLLLDETPLSEDLSPFQAIDCTGFISVKPGSGNSIGVDLLAGAFIGSVGIIVAILALMRVGDSEVKHGTRFIPAVHEDTVTGLVLDRVFGVE